MSIQKDFLMATCGLKSAVSFQEILGLALPVVVQNIPGKDTTETYNTEREVKRAFAFQHFSNSDNLDYYAQWFVDIAFDVSMNFLRTGYVQLGKFCKNIDDVYRFTDAVQWDLMDAYGDVCILSDTFANQQYAFYAISANRVKNKLQKFGWTDGQSVGDANFSPKHAYNRTVNECVERTAQYLPPYAAYCGVTVGDDFAPSNMFGEDTTAEGHANGDLEIPNESLFNRTDLGSLETMCFNYEIRHMFDGCFACCTYLQEFNFSRFAHFEKYNNPFVPDGLNGISMNNFFYNCINLQILSGTLPSPTDISYMCSGCISLEQVLVNFDIPTYHDMAIRPVYDGFTIHYAVGAFANCIHLKRFDVGYAIWMRVKNASYMFENCLSLPFMNLEFINYLQPLENGNEQFYYNVHEFANVPEVLKTSNFNVMLDYRTEYITVRTVLPTGAVHSFEVKVNVGPLLADSYARRSSDIISVAFTTAIGLEHRCERMFRNCLNLQYINIAAGLDSRYTVVSDDKMFAFENCISFVGFITNATIDAIDYFSRNDISAYAVDPITYNFNVMSNRIIGWINLMVKFIFIVGDRYVSTGLAPTVAATSLLAPTVAANTEASFEASAIRSEFPSVVCIPYIKYSSLMNYYNEYSKTSLFYTPFLLTNWKEFYKVLGINLQMDQTGLFESQLRDYLAGLDKSVG